MCWVAIRRRGYQVVASALSRRMERRHHAKILVYTGLIDRSRTSHLAAEIRRLHPATHLIMLLDTSGGDISAGLNLLHAISAHPGHVTVRVVDEGWSAGTLVACGADEIVMSPDANLGYTDAIGHVDPSELRVAMVTAAERLGQSIDLVRSRSILSYIVDAITAARIARGTPPAAAAALAERLTMTSEDHWRPLFPEHAAALGLPVSVDREGHAAWFRLACLHGRAQ